MTFLNKAKNWFLPVILILFILQVITLPIVIAMTYSNRSESPDRILTYTENKLTWDSDANIDENGAANLNLFKAMYFDVESSNGDPVIAPGTEGTSIVRLKNEVAGDIHYTAVLYRINTDERVPVSPSLKGEGFYDTEEYMIPEGIKEEDIVRAVNGTLEGGRIQDFDINWLWEFFKDETRDVIDTYLGNKNAPDIVTVGFYITVEDDNIYTPETPQTGEGAFFDTYLTLLCISAVILVILVLTRPKEKKENKTA